MFEKFDKSKITLDKYTELKTSFVLKSYTERFKWVDKFMYWFAWFGNIVSVFLAFFFIQAIFYSSFEGISNSPIITVAIVIFLGMFELLKRSILGMFSVELIKQKFKIFKVSMISFIVGVVIILFGSFYFSLNGAQEFVDNQIAFQEQTETKITTNVDSINTFYFTEYIKPLMEENKLLNSQNSDYSEQAAKTNYKTKYTNLIDANNKKIDKNKEIIIEYERKRDIKIESFKEKETSKLTKTIDDNKSNIIAFILISTLIEIIIMLGIYYDKYYTYRVLKEYEETVINTPIFKQWYQYNHILELIYTKTNDIGDKIPTTQDIIDLCAISNLDINKSTVDKLMKIFYYLEIVVLEGNRRVLNKQKDDGLKILKKYFKIK